MFKFKRKTQERNRSDEADRQFSRLAESGRIIRSYSGFLPDCRFKARHILRCEHLRDIPGERFSPYRAEPHFTHQIWLWYRLNIEPNKLYLLFRGQFDFSISAIKADQMAGEVTDFLAFLLLESDRYRQNIFRNKDSDSFWVRAVERKVKSLLA